MKKLIGILVMLLFTITIFSQSSGAWGEIYKKIPQYQRLTNLVGGDKITAYLNGDRSTYKNFEMNKYAFTNDGKYYILSYDTTNIDYSQYRLNWNERKERGLYLMCWDGNSWSRATSEPVLIDYIERKGNSPKGIMCHDMCFHSYHKKKMNGSVEKQNNGTITMTIIRQTLTDYQENHISEYYYVNVILSPTKNGKYFVTTKMVVK